MNTARRHPRNLGEAFPQTCLYACALERPPRRYPRALWIALALGFIAALLATRV